jgi:CO dehydrogenase maturation factor
MRIAFVGKGGSGKSAIAGTFARLLARTGEPVLVLDSDPMPGLALSLGLEPSDAGIPDDAVEEHPDGRPRFRLRDDLRPLDAVARYAAYAPDGVRLLQLGKLHGNVADLSRSQHAYQQILDALVDGIPPEPDAPASPPADAATGDGAAIASGSLIGDLPGGTRQPFFGWGRFANTYLVVVEPTAKSLLAARRLAHLASGWSHDRTFRVLAVPSKVREDGDAEWIAAHTGLEVLAAVPWDEELAAAERAGQAPVDGAPDSAAVAAIASLVERVPSRTREAAG